MLLGITENGFLRGGAQTLLSSACHVYGRKGKLIEKWKRLMDI